MQLPHFPPNEAMALDPQQDSGKDIRAEPAYSSFPSRTCDSESLSYGSFLATPFLIEGSAQHDSTQGAACADVEVGRPAPKPAEKISATKTKQGTHRSQDLEKARQAQVQKWGGSMDGNRQAQSLVQFLHEQHERGTIALRTDDSVPHRIAGFDVMDLAKFKSLRVKWFLREDVVHQGTEAEEDQKSSSSDQESSVNQAFRRIGLVPERKFYGRGFDWEGGKKWTFDAEIYKKYTQHKGKNSTSSPDPQAMVLDASLRCSLSKEIMMDPVLVPESGMTYERKYIEEWLETHMTDPQTGMPLQSKLLIANVNLRECIAGYFAQHGAGGAAKR